MEDKYKSKYNFSVRRNFHKERRMFAIKGRKVYLADETSELSHAEWFESLGWISSEDDFLMEDITRGYVDKEGIYFYKGYNFRIDESSEKEFFLSLRELVYKLNLCNELKVFGGMKKSISGGLEPIKSYGSINLCLSNPTQNSSECNL